MFQPSAWNIEVNLFGLVANMHLRMFLNPNEGRFWNKMWKDYFFIALMNDGMFQSIENFSLATRFE